MEKKFILLKNILKDIDYIDYFIDWKKRPEYILYYKNYIIQDINKYDLTFFNIYYDIGYSSSFINSNYFRELVNYNYDFNYSEKYSEKEKNYPYIIGYDCYSIYNFIFGLISYYINNFLKDYDKLKIFEKNVFNAYELGPESNLIKIYFKDDLINDLILLDLDIILQLDIKTNNSSITYYIDCSKASNDNNKFNFDKLNELNEINKTNN